MGEGIDDFQQFFRDVIHQGQPIRLFPNTSDLASDGYVTGHVMPDDRMIGPIDNYVRRSFSNLQLYWDVEVPFVKQA